LSVCVPVYNAAPFIERCVRSLFGQSYQELEYVFVDDGSTDGGIEIVRRVAAEYPNRQAQLVVLSHGGNRGVSAARQTALAAATGDLIVQCDPDDWVDEDLYAAMVRQIEAVNADAVMCPVSFESAAGSVLRGRADVFCLSGTEALQNMNRIPGISSLVLRIVRRELMELDAYEFPEGLSCAEDLCLSAQLLPRCRLVTNIAGGPVYHYRQNASSLSHTTKARRIVADHMRVFDVVTRKVPEDAGISVRRHLAGTVLYWGTAHGVFGRREYVRWRTAYEALGGTYDFGDRSPWGRRLMALADRCYCLVPIVSPMVRRRLHDSL